jgi:hypothetical protein
MSDFVKKRGQNSVLEVVAFDPTKPETLLSGMHVVGN